VLADGAHGSPDDARRRPHHSDPEDPDPHHPEPHHPGYPVNPHGAHGHVITALREDEHLGCRIRIKTTYEITINDRPYSGHLMLDNDGNVYTHACPYTKFGSAMDLVKRLISLYPESFAPGHAHGEPGDGHGHGAHGSAEVRGGPREDPAGGTA